MDGAVVSLPAMLLLHCGWPRTGTSSVQAVLFEHRDLLADAGIVYPDRWLDERGFGHHRLNELLAGDDADAFLDEFRRFLDSHSDQRVVLSAESFSGRLRADERLEALLALLATAREVMPVTCLWTLRRVDELLSSGYLMQLRVGRGAELPSPREYIAGEESYSSGTFDRLRRVEAAAGGAVYVKYDPGGAHNRELLAALGLDGPAMSQIVDALERGPRRNLSPRQKEAVAMANPKTLSRRTGTELDTMALCRTFARGDFCFEQDWPCELVGEDVKVMVHRRTLAAAREQGFEPYIELFAGDEVEMASPHVGLDPEILTDRDLDRLLAHLDLHRC